MSIEYTLPATYISNYFSNLVNAFYKILPMTENREPTRVEYMCGLRREMLGMRRLIRSLDGHTGFLSLLCTLSYLIDDPQCSDEAVRHDIFQAIATCNHIASEYTTEGAADEYLGKI